MPNSKFTNLLSTLIAPAAIAIPFMVAPADASITSALNAPAPTLAAMPVADSTARDSSEVFYTILKAGLALGGSAAVISILAAFLFRRVVSTNMVHIVQSGKKTVSYGANLTDGNVYYEVPTWVPGIGVSVIKLPVNNFDLSLQDYEAYDEDRVPFLIDVTAFFRIYDPIVAAQRISDTKELKHQLGLIVQGAVRKVLASDKIDNIMTQRSTFGQAFSEEVKGQLAEWGVQSIKNMELMDIRDSEKSKVIASIMAKQISAIERDSRIEVAQNQRLATVAEVENKRTAEISSVQAQQNIQLSREESEQKVGERSAEKQKAIGIAQEQSRQEVLSQQATTKEKDLAVTRIQEVRSAEIERDKALVTAEQSKKVAAIDKETALVRASQDKETTILQAEGKLAAETKEAEATKIKGLAKAEAETALNLAPVNAQITLAQEIGSNESYQKYLALIEAFKAYIAVGTEQAKSLQQADVKVIANGGSAQEGISSVMDIFSSKGGTSLAAAIEAFTQSDIGADLVSRFTDSARPSDG
jgi:flotillin